MRIDGTEANFINTTKTISTHTATEQHARVHRHIEIDMHAPTLTDVLINTFWLEGLACIEESKDSILNSAGAVTLSS